MAAGVESDLPALDESARERGGSVRQMEKVTAEDHGSTLLHYAACPILSHLILLAEGPSIDRPPHTTHHFVRRRKFWLFFHQNEHFIHGLQAF
jgi:hypothetical protein